MNLQLNPERHTCYSGPFARRGVWDAVYSQLCPECMVLELLVLLYHPIHGWFLMLNRWRM
ncbi:putative endoplasmic reticulum oxidoreductin 1, ERO1-like superfamily [Helianthus debilis subsp. tardiflorus]